ncbi:hypothetical protein AB1Y20_012949 [Prymnesium parvum]|uniref:RING-type domain-containing protein n=1 Tax=Prymnesium parvum TaxID=97485 RepID=A0AB34IM71_PRYPA
MQCATCTQPILHACLTAACGHCFHDVCAETLCSSSNGKSCCPECDVPITAEELWRTYVDCAGSSQDSQPAPTLSVAQEAIEWRRAVRVARQVDQAERLVASTCAELRQEDRALADLARVERELHVQTAAASARAAAVRKRSLHSAVLVGATVSFNRLQSTAHAGVRDEVKALAREHGHSKQQLCAVLQLLLFRLQKAYAHKLAELGSLREAERTARRRTVSRRPAVAADAPPASAPAPADPHVERGEGVQGEAAPAEAEGRRVERRGYGRKTHSFLRLARGTPKSAAAGGGGAGLDQTSQVCGVAVGQRVRGRLTAHPRSVRLHAGRKGRSAKRSRLGTC